MTDFRKKLGKCICVFISKALVPITPDMDAKIVFGDSDTGHLYWENKDKLSPRRVTDSLQILLKSFEFPACMDMRYILMACFTRNVASRLDVFYFPLFYNVLDQY